MRVIHFFTFFSSIIGILIGLVMIYGSWIDPEQPLSMIRSIGLTLFAGIIPFFSSRKAIKDRRLNIPHADEMSVLLGLSAGT